MFTHAPNACYSKGAGNLYHITEPCQGRYKHIMRYFWVSVPPKHAGGGAVVVTIAPVVCHSGVHFAALGLPHMLNGGAAVRASSLSSVDDLLQNSRTSRCHTPS